MNPSYPNRLRRIIEHLRAWDPERVYLFGSWARGEGDESSDIDLVVIMESEVPFLERSARVMKSLPGSLGGIDLLAYTADEFRRMLGDGNAFAEMLLEEGKVVYERG